MHLSQVCFGGTPRANGQVQRANCMILDALKKMLYEEEKHPGKWLKELPAMV
jgi:hypothetical protein